MSEMKRIKEFIEEGLISAEAVVDSYDGEKLDTEVRLNVAQFTVSFADLYPLLDKINNLIEEVRI